MELSAPSRSINPMDHPHIARKVLQLPLSTPPCLHLKRLISASNTETGDRGAYNS